MRRDVEAERAAALALLRRTRRMTRDALGRLEPTLVVHADEGAWQVRDVVGHLGIWNGEAARSLEAHARGTDYACIESEALYDGYNAEAVSERRSWSLARVWEEYETTHDRFETALEAVPADRWDVPLLYPWNERGSVAGLVVLMTEHETADHCEPLGTVAG
jgi:hypothetical protein